MSVNYTGKVEHETVFHFYIITIALLNDLKTVLSNGNLFIRRDILPERFLIILDGWLEFTLMYNGLVSGLLYNLFL